ncbi:MAG: hypothetical protein HY921_00255, partial [Elusimicrobia bacterium]|nr:hypothetical protein [Elusimicrobiota bacterium]
MPIQTAEGSFPQMEIEHLNLKDRALWPDFISVTLKKGDGFTRTGIDKARYKRELDGCNSDVHLRESLEALAHKALDHDIFITFSDRLLGLRERGSYKDINILAPQEALKVIGLLLRSRRQYCLSQEKGTVSVDKSGFYFYAVRILLPSMWRYLTACHIDSECDYHDIRYLAWTIIHRFIRALQARDYIGSEFYKSDDCSDIDLCLYHYYYFLLLIWGVFDAIARVAHRTYRLPNSEKNAFLDKRETAKALKDAGAGRLVSIISASSFKNFIALLKIRLSIHGKEA